MLKFSRKLTLENNKNKTSTNTDINFKTLIQDSSNVNYLKPFDTACIAYYMMGFGNF